MDGALVNPSVESGRETDVDALAAYPSKRTDGEQDIADVGHPSEKLPTPGQDLADDVLRAAAAARSAHARSPGSWGPIVEASTEESAVEATEDLSHPVPIADVIAALEETENEAANANRFSITSSTLARAEADASGVTADAIADITAELDVTIDASTVNQDTEESYVGGTTDLGALQITS